MNDKLYLYLSKHWKENNLPKYGKYFEDWIKNLTNNQINQFNRLWVVPPIETSVEDNNETKIK